MLIIIYGAISGGRSPRSAPLTGVMTCCYLNHRPPQSPRASQPQWMFVMSCHAGIEKTLCHDHISTLARHEVVENEKCKCIISFVTASRGKIGQSFLKAAHKCASKWSWVQFCSLRKQRIMCLSVATILRLLRTLSSARQREVEDQVSYSWRTSLGKQPTHTRAALRFASRHVEVVVYRYPMGIVIYKHLAGT